VLVGTVDSNQIVVSASKEVAIAKLLWRKGTPVSRENLNCSADSLRSSGSGNERRQHHLQFAVQGQRPNIRSVRRRARPRAM